METVEMRLPCYLPGEQRNWIEVNAVATIDEKGEIHIRLRDPKWAEDLVKMAREGILYQVSFDYKMPAKGVEQLTTPKEN